MSVMVSVAHHDRHIDSPFGFAQGDRQWLENIQCPFSTNDNKTTTHTPNQ